MDSPPPPSRAIEPISSPFHDGNASKLSRSMNKVTRLVIESSNRVSAIKRDEEGEGERKEGREEERKSEFKDNIYGREDRWT